MLAALLLVVSAATPGLDQAIRNAGDPCHDAAKASNEITVCAKHNPASERYRLPQMPDQGFDPLGSVDSVSREWHRLMDGVQDQTRGLCSAVGASGTTGCTIKAWREHDQQKGW